MSFRSILKFPLQLRSCGRSKIFPHAVYSERKINYQPPMTTTYMSSKPTNPHLDQTNRRLSMNLAPNPHLDLTNRRLSVNLAGVEEQFPWVWLRDSCQCRKCFEPVSHSRVVNLTEWDLNVKPTQIEAQSTGVQLTWSDGHVSVYDYQWLAERSFSVHRREQFRRSVNTPQHLWGRELLEDVPTVNYNDIMENDDTLLDWLENLDKFGFVLVRNVPVREGPVPALQERVAFEKMTHYGPGYTVEVRADPANISHTHHRIFFHTDLTYYDHMAGAVFLHCIEQHQGEGGETMLTDGFHAAALLKQDHPQMYKLLAETVSSFRDVGRDYIKFDKISQQPFLIHNGWGDLVRINWSHFARENHLDVDIDVVEDLFKAMRTLDDLMNNAENHIRLKMMPGDMITVKNTRVLHGRSELQGGVSGRHLQCGYMDWDEIRSTIRVTRNKLGRDME